MIPVKSFVFDFGGVLIDWNPRYVFRSVFSDPEEMEYFLSEIAPPVFFGRHADLSYGECLALLQERHPEYAWQIDLYREKWKEMFGGVFPETVALLEELASRFPVYGLTNWISETFEPMKDSFDFFRFFSGIVVSGEEKCAKPDERIFQILMRRYGLTPSESVFIDDAPENVEAACRIGFQGILFCSAEQLRDELKAKGIFLSA